MDKAYAKFQPNIWNANKPMARRVSDPEADARFLKRPPAPENVRLSFETQRIINARKPKAVSEIMMNASTGEVISFQATLPVMVNNAKKNISDFTTTTLVTLKDFKRSQAFMIISTSFLGTLIGIFIAYLL